MFLNLIMVYFIPMVVARHHHGTLLENILMSKGNFFSKVNEDVQNVMNNLFYLLNLSAEFPKKTRIKLMLTMHYDMNRISEKNYDIYDKMENASKIYIINKITNKVDLFELIEEMLNDKNFNMSGKIKEKKHRCKNTKHKAVNKITESEFRNSKEFMEFIQEFINKVEKLSVNDFSKQLNRPNLISSEHDNIEDLLAEDEPTVWQPPSVIESDYRKYTDNRRIFKGTKSMIKSFPFIASIHIMEAFACAGSIIKKDLIITAASCLQLLYNNRFYRENPKSIFVRIGSDFYSRGGEKISVIETYFHPAYDPKSLKNNLVILRLSRIIKFLRKKKGVRRILYDRNTHHLPSNTEGVFIVGWGSKRESNIIDPFQKLLVSELEIYPFNDCIDIYSSYYVNINEFCAGFLSSGGGACNKDIGGPGIVSGKLVGIVSFGPPVCGTINAPTVFTKVGFYAAWIDSIMRMRSVVVDTRTTAYMPELHRPKNVYTIYQNEYFMITPYKFMENYRAELAPTTPVDLNAIKNKTLVHEYVNTEQDDVYKDLYTHPLSTTESTILSATDLSSNINDGYTRKNSKKGDKY